MNGRKRRKEENKKIKTKPKKGDKNQKNKKNETQKERNTTRKRNKGGKDKPFISVVVWGCWPLSGQNPAREQGQKKTL